MTADESGERVARLLEHIHDPELRAEVREFSSWPPEEQRHHLYLAQREDHLTLKRIEDKLDQALSRPMMERILGAGGITGLIAYVLWDLGIVKR